MVKIIREGTRPEPPAPPWYLMLSLTCPQCGAAFQLEEDDVASAKNKSAAWHVRTERSPNGKSEATGPCPYCAAVVTIARPPRMDQPGDWQQLARGAKIGEG